MFTCYSDESYLGKVETGSRLFFTLPIFIRKAKEAMIVSQRKIMLSGSLGSGMASPFTQMTHVQSPLQVLTAEPGEQPSKLAGT